MVNITLSLPEETVKKLRRVVKENYRGKKGALSSVVNDAIEEHLSTQVAARPPTKFKAFDGTRLVAEAHSLDELASMLREQSIDPRGVRILSSTPLRQVVRAGLRGRRA